MAPVILPLNSLVIRGKEPVVVDTGFAHSRDEFLADVFSVVEPDDIRWVFISHDDVDHTGNLNALMEAAPNATAIIDWFMAERMGGTLEVSPLRQRWVGDGDVVDVGDRKLLTIRPADLRLADDARPVRHDDRRLLVVRLVRDADGDCRSQRDRASTPGYWKEGMPLFNRWVSPWLELVDDAKFQKTVDRIEQLSAQVIAGCHTPAIPRSHIPAALEATRRSPSATVLPQPDQEVLDQIQLAMMAAQ